MELFNKRSKQVFDTEVAGTPGIAVDRAGRVVVLVRGAAKGTLHVTRQQPDGSWTEPADLGEPIEGDPVASRAADGRIGVFYRGPGNELRVLAEKGDGGWGPALTVAGEMTGNPVVAHLADGRMVLHYINAEYGALWHCWTASAGPEGFAPELLGGGSAVALAAGRLADGRQVAWHVNDRGELWEIAQEGPNSSWGGFTYQGNGVTPTLAAGIDDRGHAHLAWIDDSALTVRTRRGDGVWTDPATTRPDSEEEGEEYNPGYSGTPSVIYHPATATLAILTYKSLAHSAYFTPQGTPPERSDGAWNSECWAVNMEEQVGGGVVAVPGGDGRIVMAYITNDPRPRLGVSVLGAHM
ncbi:hypothetical protein OG782_34515 [Streptomyces sp. NBC_00876]|uniref:hypothetical protein n=1 Tax=Streptomyces sp. NBC_00876 TaxID=2975853 RepID=UPI00386EFD66|nr:hypothetical protein OG782_34515 [Streptomyces sp. NBC_00876]